MLVLRIKRENCTCSPVYKSHLCMFLWELLCLFKCTRTTITCSQEYKSLLCWESCLLCHINSNINLGILAGWQVFESLFSGLNRNTLFLACYSDQGYVVLEVILLKNCCYICTFLLHIWLFSWESRTIITLHTCILRITVKRVKAVELSFLCCYHLTESVLLTSYF